MIKLTNAALFFLAAGLFTSVSILSGFQVLFAISVAYYTYLAFKNMTYQLPKSAWWLLGFVVVAIISLSINHDIIPKPSKNWGRLKYYLYGVGGIFVMRVWLIEASDQAKKILVNTLFVCMIIAGLYCSYQVLALNEPRASSLTETMRYGYGTAMVLLILISALLHRHSIGKWFDPRIALAAVIIAFAGMYFTYTRGALLALICGLPIVLYFYRPKLALASALVALLGGGILGYFYFYGNVEQGQGSRFIMSKNNNGDMIRRSQWKAAIIAIQERPILGYGLSNFHSQLKRIKETYDLDAKDYNDAHSHNLFLEVASGTGLLGLFFFLAWIVSWIMEMWRSRPLVRAMIMPFGAAWLIGSQFEVTLDANNASMIFFLYALSVATLPKKV